MNRLNNSHAITDADPMKSPVHQQPYFEQNSPQFRPPTFQSTPQYRFNNQDQYSPRQFHSTPRGSWQNRGRGRGHNNYKKNFDVRPLYSYHIDLSCLFSCILWAKHLEHV